MTGLVLQNDRSDPPGLLGKWAGARGVPFEILDPGQERVPVDPSDYDWIAVLGSHHSVNDPEPSWIGAEIELLARAVEARVPTLDICFGAQALSVALGGEVSGSEFRPGRVGWLKTSTRDPEVVPAGPWLHLNRERFSVPPSAELLAESPGGPAAFRVGPHLGVQFHPEATPAVVERWAVDLKDDLESARITPAQLREQGRIHWPGAQARAFALFDAWWAMGASDRASRQSAKRGPVKPSRKP